MESPTSKFIKEIVCVDSGQNNKFKVVLNGNYKNPIEGDKAISSWSILFRIADEEPIEYKEINKGNLDYFNSNKNNKIYTRTGYNLTKILKKERRFVVPNIEMEVISEKAFETRKNKA